jgi:hypothetical protein
MPFNDRKLDILKYLLHIFIHLYGFQSGVGAPHLQLAWVLSHLPHALVTVLKLTLLLKFLVSIQYSIGKFWDMPQLSNISFCGKSLYDTGFMHFHVFMNIKNDLLLVLNKIRSRKTLSYSWVCMVYDPWLLQNLKYYHHAIHTTWKLRQK